MDDHGGAGVRVSATVARVQRPWGDLVIVADWLRRVRVVLDYLNESDDDCSHVVRVEGRNVGHVCVCVWKKNE